MKVRTDHSRRFNLPRRWQAALTSIVLATALLDAAQALAQSAGEALQLNDSGDAVVELQQRLIDLGYYSGEITGFYGSQTQEAVAHFQQDAGLTTDGVVGAATETALRAPGDPSRSADQTSSADQSAPTTADAPRSLVRLGDSGEQIAELQRRLADLGYYNASASGMFDRPTEVAVQQFQKDNGLIADGVVGASTEVALRQPAGQSASSPAAVNPASSSAAASPTAAAKVSMLRLGDTGAAVAELQSNLSDRGFYQGEITGNYDAPTQTAVMTLQRSRGLVVDGVAGQQVATALGITGGFSQGGDPQTWRQIQQAHTEAQQSRQEADRAKQQAEQARLEAEQARLVLNQNLQENQYSVSELQRHLQRRGYNPGGVTGVLTPETQTAVTEAQRRYGLSESDLAGGSP
jgi:peptidoglycan hydrolase-like protein with peptidoglycan-binding domain